MLLMRETEVVFGEKRSISIGHLISERIEMASEILKVQNSRSFTERL